MLILVKPANSTEWGVFIADPQLGGDVLFGTSKHSFDCDYWAERLADMFDERPEVKHFPEARAALVIEMEAQKKRKGSK
jgi:hypothetical protein